MDLLKYINVHLKKGYKFYLKNFFLPDGTVKYYHNKIYPIDIHSPSQAIVFFSKLREERFHNLATKVLQWMLNNMYDRNGNYFYFRRYKMGLNKIYYLRWSQAWAIHALTEYYANLQKDN